MLHQNNRDSHEEPPKLPSGERGLEVDAGLGPSYFPCLDARPGLKATWQSTEVPFKDRDRLREFCRENDILPLSVFQIAWALTLRCYIGSLTVCFARRSSFIGSSEAGVFDAAGIDDTCKIAFAEASLVLDLLKDPSKNPKRRSGGSSQEQSKGFNTLSTNTSLIYEEVARPGSPRSGRLATQDYALSSSNDVRPGRDRNRRPNMHFD